MFGQWATGGLGHFSVNERSGQAEYGAGARIGFATSLRSSFFGDMQMNIPRVEQWDNSYGARGVLSVGIAPFTRHRGEHLHFQETLSVGCTRRIGRIHRRVRSAYIYWGVARGLVHQALRYATTVTNLLDGTQASFDGTADHFDVRIGPMLGFRSRESGGRFFAEATPTLQHALDERSAAWDLRYAIAIGYLWNLGD